MIESIKSITKLDTFFLNKQLNLPYKHEKSIVWYCSSDEEKQVEFELNKDAFTFYNPETHAWEVESGKFEI